MSVILILKMKTGIIASFKKINLTTDFSVCSQFILFLGRDYIRPLYWSCALLKTRYLVRNVVLQPISNMLGI